MKTSENATASSAVVELFLLSNSGKLLSRIRGSGILVAMMLCSFCAVAQTGDKKHDSLLAQADTLLQQQDYTGALALYDQVLSKSKTLTDATYPVLYKRAYCHYALNEFQSALTDINTYIAKVPDDQAKLLRAYINQELEDYDAQLTDLNEFLEANPGSPELLRWRASVLMESGRFGEAQQDIRTLLAVQPGPELKAYLGLTYYYQNKPDSALLIFDEVIQGTPEYVQPYQYAASLFLEEQAYDLALSYINKGLAVDPQNLTLIFYKGAALVEDDRVDEGCKCLTKAFNGGMDEVADYLKSYCYGAD